MEVMAQLVRMEEERSELEEEREEAREERKEVREEREGAREEEKFGGRSENRTNGGNIGPMVHHRPSHRRYSRLDLEEPRRACRAETGRRAKSCATREGHSTGLVVQEGPLLHGVGHLDTDSCCRTDMEIGRRGGGPPRFPYDMFWEHQKAYTGGPEKRVWESFVDLRRAAAQESSATILGHIDAETFKKWFGWDLGPLYVVGYRGSMVFCAQGGFVVIRYPPLLENERKKDSASSSGNLRR